jgi:chemotaxis signal transduction protein
LLEEAVDELGAFPRDDDETVHKRADSSEYELLVIEQGELVLGIPAKVVDSVVPWTSPAALPRTSPWVLGIIQDRGRLVAVRKAEKDMGAPQRIVLCVTSKGLVGIPATNTRSIGSVRVLGVLRHGQPVDTDHGALTILDIDIVASQMTE